jgi:mono/diheme cytochrome c family protein
VDLACIRCHAPNGVGGVPNQLNAGGDSTIPPLNNQFRADDEQFRAAPQITQILAEGGIVSKKPGVINMPSWKGVINDAQANAIAAYILAGFPDTGAAYDPDPATAEDIYSVYACVDCHGQVGGKTAPSPAPNPETEDKIVPALRNPDDAVPLSELRSVLMEGSIPDPGTKGVIFMPAWGQILSIDQMNTILPYIADGPLPTPLPAPVPGTPLPLAGGASSPAPSSSASP